MRAPPPSPPASQGSLPGQRPAWHRSLCHAGGHLLRAIWPVTQRASCKLDLHVATPPRTRPPACPCTSVAPSGSVQEQQFLYRMLLAGPLCEPAPPTSTWHSDMVCSGHTTRRLRPLTRPEPCWEKGRAVDANLHRPPREKNEVVRGSWGCYGQSRRASLLKARNPLAALHLNTPNSRPCKRTAHRSTVAGDSEHTCVFLARRHGRRRLVWGTVGPYLKMNLCTVQVGSQHPLHLLK